MNLDTIRARSALTASVRGFFFSKAYLEVETPLLAPALIPESAIEVFKARFEHPWQGPRDMYLVPSPELWMKRLLAEGFGNMFQICKAFRNAESIGRQHNPEFTILEYYTVDAGYLDSLELTEDFFGYLCEAASCFAGGENLKRLRPPFRRMSMAEAFEAYARVDLASFAPRGAAEAPASAKALTGEALGKGLPAKEGDSWEEAFNRIFVGAVEPALPRDRPLAILDYPRGVRCLARDIPGGPWNERWELYAGGMEIANCFTEEDDPDRVAAYFSVEAALKRKALVPHAVDGDFLALYANTGEAPGRARDWRGARQPRPQGRGRSESAAPQGPVPSAGRNAPKSSSGVALGLDRLFMAILGEGSIGGVILFPFSDILRPH
jgi:lysyl-tRNA synthetase class 2